MPSTTYDTTAALSVRDIADRTDSAGTAVTDYTGEEDRFAHILLGGGVIRPDNGWKVAPQGGTMTILVGSGTARVDYAVVEGQVAGQGNYIVRLDETQVALTLGGSDGANQRTDEVYLVVRDDPYDATARGLPQLAVRQGDVGGGAPGPDGSWQAYLLLATIVVGAGVTEITDGAITDERVQATFVEATAAGTVRMTARQSAAPGWLLCNGQAVSRTDFSRLFRAIGTTYGNGDGSTTFNVPNFDGRFPVGAGTLGADTYARGTTGGSARHTLSTAEMPAHNHGAAGSHAHTASSGSAGGHSHSASSGNQSSSHTHSGSTGTQSSSHSHSGTTGSDSHSHTASSAGTHTHDLRTDALISSSHGHAQSFTRTPPRAGGRTNTTDTVSENEAAMAAGGHTHSTTSASHSHSFTSGNQSSSHSHSFTTGTISANHSHSITVNSVASHTHTVTVDGATSHTHATNGSGSAHENRPPFLGVNFEIKT